MVQSVFYNGTIEVVESEGFLTTEFVFLFTLGAALVGLLGLWFYSRMQHYSKKMKRMPKIEVDPRQTETNMDDWLEVSLDEDSACARVDSIVAWMVVKQVDLRTAEKAGSTFKLCKEELVQVVDRQPVLSYIDELANPGNKLVSQLRDVMELREGLEEVEERIAKGDCDVGMRKRCKTYRVYRFVN
ncbi:Translocon-associated protein subunit alpha [Carex littledalei]|uniref:Translocon-associated protein subunit alpha n=1 Tax=Carex littledalei TaxID=544730 RepID=A0A833R9L5_9POAL|nr:Translocon-associated protein subunit alpha [Carex littledalei]